MAHLDSHWDAVRDHLRTHGLILGLQGAILALWEIILGALGFHFERPGTPHGHFFLIWQRFCQKYEDRAKT